VSFFKRLFGRTEPSPPELDPEPEPEQQQPVVEESPAGPGLDHFAIITIPAPPRADEEPEEEPAREPEEPVVAMAEEPVVEEPPLAEPQPTVESPVVIEEAEHEPEEAPVAVEAPPEPAGEEITVGRLTEDDVRGVLERALDELGSAHHRPFSRG
jgi:hypothetical protein